jgi:putative ABC transport system permease protein
MRTLDRKLIRDLWHMRGQLIAIIFVLAAGVAMFVLSTSNYESLDYTKDKYYREHRFADLFLHLKRAPKHLKSQIDQIDGIRWSETSIITEVNLDGDKIDGLAVGHLVSLPLPYRDGLNKPYLVKGRFPVLNQEGEVLISEPFAEENALLVGDHFSAIINGRRKDLTVVGIALSPEFIYAIKPGQLMPDNKNYGIIWIGEESLAAAMDMQGAFNNVTAILEPKINPESVAEPLETLLESYGAGKAIAKDKQMSNWFVENELRQLETMGLMIPIIFFSVAIFLLNMVVSRLVQSQREQVAIMKAFGYRTFDLAWHYLQFVLVIVVFGNIMGVLFGMWMGRSMVALYVEFFKFPELIYLLRPQIVVQSVLISALVAIIGTLGSLWKAVAIPPAEAMKAEPPASFKPTYLERIGLGFLVGYQSRMIIRNLERAPKRSGLAIAGMSLASAIMVLGNFGMDSVDELIRVQYFTIQREDLTIRFYEPRPYRSFFEIANQEEVSIAEGIRTVAAEAKAGHRSRAIEITGLPSNPELRRPLNQQLEEVTIPKDGLVLSRTLADVLGVTTGDELDLEVLEGRRPKISMQIVSLIDEYMGTSAYVHKDYLNALMGEDRAVNVIHAVARGPNVDALFQRLKETPAVAAVTLKTAALDGFRKATGENMAIMTFFNVMFAVIIAFGVVYNSAQIILNERTRDLATLRVLGFTRAEISTILLGELFVIMLISLPIGCMIGYALAASVAEMAASELFRLPLVIHKVTYVKAIVTVVGATLLTALYIRRKLDRLDLMTALKARE